MKLRMSVSFAITFVLIASSTPAHHSYPSFAMDKKVLLSGTLTKVDWRNPHVAISIDIKNDQDRVESWFMEGAPPAAFTRFGIDKDSFAKSLGQTVTVEAGLARDGARHGSMRAITFPDGTTTPQYPSG